MSAEDYMEPSQMIRLTPLRETTSELELLKEDRVEIVLSLLKRRYTLSTEMADAVALDLNQLTPQQLRTLLNQLLDFETFEQLEVWIAGQMPR